MRKTIVIVLALALVAMSQSGCRSRHHTRESDRGGTIPRSEEFSIVVPTGSVLEQGSGMYVTVSLHRSADFKRDVQLNLNVRGLDVIPNAILVRAEDRPEVQVEIKAAKDAAVGDYHVYVKGTPASGVAASTQFKVAVINRR